MSDLAGSARPDEGRIAASNVVRPTTAEEVRRIVEDAAARREAVYPVGGGLALEELLPKSRPGIDLSLIGLDRIVEFSPRDLTITVEAGMTLANLARTVDEEGLLFPFASPIDEQSTIGGVLATAWNGPRRTGWGNLRDYVIGMRAIDGRGVAFKSGGKVVKNVTGYDLVKLLVGSRGTLGIVTEATLRLKPRPESSWQVFLAPKAEQSLAELCEDLRSPAIPYSVYEAYDVVSPSSGIYQTGCGARLRWEGAVEEIDVAKRQIEALVRSGRYEATEEPDADSWLAPLPHAVQPVPPTLTIRVQAPPTVAARALGGEWLSRLPGTDLVLITLSPQVGGATLEWRSQSPEPIARAQALAALRADVGDDGYVTVQCDRFGLAPTRELRYGRTNSPQFLMEKVKAAMDPQGILNPGRYVFADAMTE